MVQIQQKGVYGVENPPLKSFLGGYQSNWAMAEWENNLIQPCSRECDESGVRWSWASAPEHQLPNTHSISSPTLTLCKELSATYRNTLQHTATHCKVQGTVYQIGSLQHSHSRTSNSAEGNLTPQTKQSVSEWQRWWPKWCKGWQKCQISFRGRATNHRALLQKMNYNGKASYGGLRHPVPVIRRVVGYGVATISRLLKIIGLFCKRALYKRLCSAKETYDFKEPTNRSHPIGVVLVNQSHSTTWSKQNWMTLRIGLLHLTSVGRIYMYVNRASKCGY